MRIFRRVFRLFMPVFYAIMRKDSRQKYWATDDQMAVTWRKRRRILEILSVKDLVFLGKIHYPNFVAQQGRTLFVSGESGSGKSSLFKLLNGVETPSAGQVFYAGQDIAALNTVQLRREVLLVSQSVFLFEDTIAGNFARFYEYRGLPGPSEADMAEMLRLCGIDFPLDTQAATMSGGERQRVYIAIFLSLSPKVLLLDEPTSALDAQHARLVLQNIKDHCAARGITLLAISHDASLVEAFADKVITLSAVAPA